MFLNILSAWVKGTKNTKNSNNGLTNIEILQFFDNFYE